MSENAPKFRREPAEKRKEALVLATLALIAEGGVRSATVRAIAARAEVTQGLIRHYFASKEDLVMAAYEYHMSALTNQAAASISVETRSHRASLASFVEASLKPPVVDPGAVSLWAGFLNKVREDARMQAIHAQTYFDFRNRLEQLIADALAEAQRPTTPEELRGLAIACNALIDGLWMEGGALPGAFEPGELPRIGLRSVGAIIGLELTERDEAPS